MRVLGLDPGLERVGYGLVERDGSTLRALAHGLIETPRIGLAARLGILHERITAVLDDLAPDEVAVERLVFSVNRKTAIDVAKAFGVLLLAVSQRGIEPTEYAPQQVKQAVVGNGAAEKHQVQFMVERLLNLPEPPRPDDVGDALALAICHCLHSRGPAAAGPGFPARR